MQVIDNLLESRPGRVMMKMTKYSMRVFGAFMSFSAFALIVAGIVFFFYVMMPLYSEPPSLFFLFNFFAGLFVSFNLLFNFVQTVRVDPGSPAKEWSKSQDIEEGINSERQLPYCNRCSSPKPPRAHHCHICDKCVSRMDHHCPWVNNCIGYQNHRYFVLFLFYLWFGCLYISVTYLLVVIGILPYQSEVYEEWHNWLMFFSILTGSLALTLTGFLGWHSYLICTNQTTIEFQINKFRLLQMRTSGQVAVNEYHIGIWNNIEQVFGKQKHFWGIFLPSTKPLPLDGVHWPTIHNVNKFEQKGVNLV